ncbi:MAG TPA: hypothetical protein PLU72_16060 [Candidatus Ozemobacteraceae bacterium]|nr:hypothetical protein [Candidatus Ozemobacteraceae bacterium]
MKSILNIARYIVLIVSLALIPAGIAGASDDIAEAGMPNEDIEPIGVQTHRFVDHDGEVKLTVEWLRRPGEFAVTIDYFGYLTQEGRVNCYLELNGTRREFITLRESASDRHQRIRILSFHPTVTRGSSRGLKKLTPEEVVDYLLFTNAPYYPQFGNVNVEMKFFSHGRWDGDGNNNNENYRISFPCPIKVQAEDHF